MIIKQSNPSEQLIKKSQTFSRMVSQGKLIGITRGMLDGSPTALYNFKTALDNIAIEKLMDFSRKKEPARFAEMHMPSAGNLYSMDYPKDEPFLKISLATNQKSMEVSNNGKVAVFKPDQVLPLYFILKRALVAAVETEGPMK